MDKDSAIEDAANVARETIDELAPRLEAAARRLGVALPLSGKKTLVEDLFRAAIRVIGAEGGIAPIEVKLFRRFFAVFSPENPWRDMTDDALKAYLFSFRYYGQEYLASAAASFVSLDKLKRIDGIDCTAHADRLASAIFRVAYLLARSHGAISPAERRELLHISPAELARTPFDEPLKSQEGPTSPRPGLGIDSPESSSPSKPRRDSNPTTSTRTENQAIATVKPSAPVGELLAELDALTGLAGIKTHVRAQCDYIRVQQLRKSRDLRTDSLNLHSVFVGNPGTGKTTVARLLGEIYHSLGVLPKGHFVETDRAGLVGAYLGQTAIKTAELIEKARGGVLFIDEAYALTGSRSEGDSYGNEAVATLLKRMEDLRGELVVIVAGYPDEMGSWIKTNPGLQSRFPQRFVFEDYSAPELLSILRSLAKNQDYRFARSASVHLEQVLAHACQSRDKFFGNGRYARNLFESAVRRQAGRVINLESASRDELMTLEAIDIHSA